MSYISIHDDLSVALARRALVDERFLLHVKADERKRYIAELAEKIADAINEELNHYRETLGALRD